MKAGIIFCSPIDRFAGEQLSKDVNAYLAVWQSSSGPVGFGKDAVSIELLKRLVENSWRMDLHTNSMLSYSESINRDCIWFCRGNHLGSKYIAAPIVVDPTKKSIDRLNKMLSDDTQCAKLWGSLASPTPDCIRALAPVLSGSAYIFIAHPLEWSLLCISIDSDSFPSSLLSATKDIDAGLEILPLNAALPEW